MQEQGAAQDVRTMACEIDGRVRALPVRNAQSVRAIRREHSKRLKGAGPDFVLDLGRELLTRYGRRWLAYELIRNHREAFRSIGAGELEELGQGMDSWGAVESFARLLSGPAWLQGQVDDALIHAWSRSEDRWWRRAALVSTVALNVRSRGGPGDVPRTLAVCRVPVDDHDDMVVKAMSWALRELVVHDAEAVRGFLRENEGTLEARVKREVRNKLTTGLKTPRRQRAAS